MGRRRSKNKRKRGGCNNGVCSLPRGSGGISRLSVQGGNAQQRKWHDLDVPLFQNDNIISCSISSSSSSIRGQKKKMNHKALTFTEENKLLAMRLQQTGFSVMSFSHMVYGKVETDVDNANVAIPSFNLSNTIASSGKKRKRNANEDSTTPQNATSRNNDKKPIVILRRLNIVIEEASQLSRLLTSSASTTTSTRNSTSSSMQSSANEVADVLSSYDLIAINPRNDTAFSSACACSSSTSMVDIITLDYTAGRGGVQLPYKLKKADVKIAVENGISFELAYGPAIVDVAKRKALIQTAMQFHSVTMGMMKKPKLILSSGSRYHNGKDHSAMALRTPGDLINLLITILGFEQSTTTIRAADTLHTFPQSTILQANHRNNNSNNASTNTGINGIVTVQLEDTNNNDNQIQRDDSSSNRPPAVGSIHHLLSIGKQKLSNKNSNSEKITPTNQITTNHNDNTKILSDEDDNDDTEEGFIRF